MSTDEFAVIAAALRTYYSRFDLLPNEQAISLWYDSLKDIPVSVLSAALKTWVVTEKWPPTIADLREKADVIVNGERPDWGIGWHEVQQAIQKYGYMQPEKAIASMGPVTQEAVRRIGWQSICESENPETIRAQFRQVYEICEKRNSADRNLPPELKSMIGDLLSAGSRPQLEGYEAKRHADTLHHPGEPGNEEKLPAHRPLEARRQDGPNHQTLRRL